MPLNCFSAHSTMLRWLRNRHLSPPCPIRATRVLVDRQEFGVRGSEGTPARGEVRFARHEAAPATWVLLDRPEEFGGGSERATFLASG